ncbi:MAG: polysaccharide deacetylase family protein [Verrucomicrobia bacterium]|nr:polysaccharide deacetylase family protein [Verrucomicrobiota bacterium]
MKKLLASLVRRLAYASGFSLARAKGMKVARVVMFHGVGDDEYSTAEFKEHLELFAKHFTVVPLHSLIRKMENREAFTDELALTFDDGLRNNFTEAYPVLKRLQLPATFFVCPGIVESKGWLWNQEARARLQSLGVEQRLKVFAELGTGARLDVESVIEWMKHLSIDARLSAEQTIRLATDTFRPSPVHVVKYEMMTWDDLRSLDPRLITIGSHTVNHPILATLESDELRFEISESRRLLEEKLGRTVDQFCYPNGSHNPAVVEEVRKHYRAAVTTEPGFVDGADDLVQLPRIGIVPQPLLSWRMHRPTA